MFQHQFYRILLILISFLSINISAQTVKLNIPWESQTIIANPEATNKAVLYFPKASYDKFDTPQYKYIIKTGLFKEIESVSIDIVNKQSLTKDERKVNLSDISTIETTYISGISKNKKIHTISFPTVLKNEKILEVELNITWKNNTKKQALIADNYPTTTPLSTGTWFKVETHLKGVHKITGSDLANANISLGDINPANIRVFGQNKGMLPEMNNIDRPLGLTENAIQVIDGNDGSFQANDYILFYAAGPDQWVYNTSKDVFQHETNIYSDKAYYFINVDGGVSGKRISNATSVSSTNTTVTSYDEYWFHENQYSNLERTGREWFGEKFDITEVYNYNINSPNRIVQDPVYVEYRTVANSTTSTDVNFKIGSSIKLTQTLPPIPTIFEYPPKATTVGAESGILNFPNTNISFSLAYDKNNNFNAFAYLDYITLNYRNKLVFGNEQIHFRDKKSWQTGGNASFNFTSTASTLNIWDITEHTDIKNQNYSSNSFKTNVNELKEFIAFNPEQVHGVDNIASTNNQNLHSILQADYILIYHPNFKASAQELKEFHENYSGYSVAFVSTEEIYNEFSSGRQDLTALRDFLKMLYHRNIDAGNQPKAVMLFGDASYDYKDYSDNNSNFIPTYEQPYSLSIASSTATDDYIVCMDENEGNPLHPSNYVDIPIGRFVIQTNQQGFDMINKIKTYINYDSHGAWQNLITLVTDDVDEAWERPQLTYRANQIIDNFAENNINYNINKIYTDAYQQTNSSGGQRYLEAERAINTSVEEGSLIVHYYGHGGESGWATERILDIETINKWTNINSLPAFVTTTCEFTRYDDLTRISAGELVQLNPNGGSIALFTSTRQLNVADANKLSLLFYENLNKTDANNEHLTMGEIISAIKQDYSSTNKRRFILVGDPGLKLNYPKNKINITSVNGQNPLTYTDTIKALSKVELLGQVTDLQSNLLSNFNGTLSITVFDKTRDNETLNNDNTTDNDGVELLPIQFTTQTNKIFKGEANVDNGTFKVEFIVPKDINFNVAKGKISMYAKTISDDAWGTDTNLLVGSIIPNPDEDNLGPQISLYMNDVSFVDGGLTSNAPDIYAILSDSNGINAVGTGVGHDISAVIDANSDKPIILNDFYKTFPNSFKKGDLRYPLNDLAEGEHTLSLRAWDNYNNSNTEEITFVVARNEKVALSHVLNYPNPFTSYTDFQFEHNYENQTIEAQIQIFTISGKLVKTIYKEIDNPTARVHGELIWDGLDDFGNSIGRGVYIYKLSVKIPESGKSANKTEKLVIIK